MSKILSPQQLGFKPGRYMAEHGVTLQAINILVSSQDSSTIGLLLDQEKAYDRIHPDYLAAVMIASVIPSTMIQSILSIFFQMQIQVNVSGHITTNPFQQPRRLRQGDPLSPLLFNIAFDPFLRSIVLDTSFQVFDFTKEAPSNPLHHPTNPPNLNENNIRTSSASPLPLTAPPPIKILAYADDTLVFLRNQGDFERRHQAVNIYSQASNALLNYSKTQALSLSGKVQHDWVPILFSANISRWHDRRLPTPLIYLGYAICSAVSQRNFHFQIICEDRVCCI